MKQFDRTSEHFAVIHAASKGATRLNIGCVRFEPSGRTVATDGHILATVGTEPLGTQPLENECYSFPIATAKTLIRSAEGHTTQIKVEPVTDGTPGLDPRRVTVTRNGASTTTVEERAGDYPDWRVVAQLPEKEYEIALGLKVLESLVKTAKEFAKHANSVKGDKNMALRFQFHGPDRSVKVTSTDPDETLTIIAMPIRID